MGLQPIQEPYSPDERSTITTRSEDLGDRRENEYPCSSSVTVGIKPKVIRERIGITALPVMVLSTRASRSGAWILSAGWTSRKSSVCCNARSRLCAYIGGAEGSTPSDSPNPFELSSVSSPMLRGSGRCSLAQPFSSPATTAALYTMPMATSTFPHSTPQKRANKPCIDRSLLSEATATRQQDNLLHDRRLLSEHCSSGCCEIGVYRDEESAKKLLWHGRNSMARRIAGRDTRDWREKRNRREFEVFGTSNRELRTSDRAFLAIHAPRPVALADFFGILLEV